jgi:hypothetical protein
MRGCCVRQSLTSDYLAGRSARNTNTCIHHLRLQVNVPACAVTLLSDSST